MPIDMIQLSVAFSELPKQEKVIARLINELFEHPNMIVRRIAISACRHSQMFDVPGLKEALTDKLSDPEAWVRYDTAWTIREAKYDSPVIRQKLERNANGINLQSAKKQIEEQPGRADLQARIQAQETLNVLIANDN